VKIPANQIQSTLQKYILADGMHIIYDMDRSHDSYIVDGASGKEYLDLFSFFATQPVAHNHPKIIDPVFREKIARIALHRPTLSDIYVAEYAEFVDTFGRIAGKNYFKYFFFVEGGAMGVENALKAAMDWKVRKNLKAGKGEKGQKIIHFKNAFHGRSGYTVSMTNTFHPNKHQYFAKMDWPRISVSPALQFPITDEILQNTIALEKQVVSEIKEVLSKNKDDIAALILETIQCEGGDNHFRKEFYQSLRTLADENEFLLIFDEVQTGIGTTGKMWGFEHFGVVPDLISFGKKVQVAGCASTGRIDDVPDNVFKLSGRINSTWGGNLVDMVRCQKLLEIIEQENLVENASHMGDYFLQELRKLGTKHPKLTNVRGRGLLIAFDLPTPSDRDQIMKKIFDHGAMTLSCGERSIRLRPHLDITKNEVDHAIQIFDKSLA
jgi:L-lysine 6-transaminase